MTGMEKVVLTETARKHAIAELKARGMLHLAALYEGLGMGAEFILVPRDKTPLFVPLRPSRQGLTIVIGDDLDTAEGPPGFHLPTLRQLAGKAAAWAVMAGAPVVAVYEAATTIAAGGEKVIIIETQPPAELSWTRFLTRHGQKNAAKLLYAPSAGKPA
jgi:hypothetical protein